MSSQGMCVGSVEVRVDSGGCQGFKEEMRHPWPFVIFALICGFFITLGIHLDIYSMKQENCEFIKNFIN